MLAHLLVAAIGVWLMVSPDVLGYGSPAATVDRIVGPLVASFALIAVWGVTRGLRWINVALGAGMILAPVLLGYGRVGAINALVSGTLVSAVSLVRGRAKHSCGGGWGALRSRHRVGER